MGEENLADEIRRGQHGRGHEDAEHRVGGARPELACADDSRDCEKEDQDRQFEGHPEGQEESRRRGERQGHGPALFDQPAGVEAAEKLEDQGEDLGVAEDGSAAKRRLETTTNGITARRSWA